MKKQICTIFAFCFLCTAASAQQQTNKKDSIVISKADSLAKAEQDVKDQMVANIPVVTLDENDFGDGGQNISSILTAGRDPFFNAASYNFSPTRFRIRGYDGELFATFMNGVSMDNLDNGFTPFSLWGGLNDAMRSRDLSIGLRPNTFAFGDLGSTTFIDVRASKQRKQTEVGYAYSNRSAFHRVDFTHGTGISKKGWAFVFSGSRRYTNEGYVPGTHFDSWSWLVGVDKRFGNKHLLSLVAFGTPSEVGRQGTSVQETFDLVGSNYYNPSWGWQNGKKRNANTNRTNQPYVILTHDFRINNSTSLVTAASFSTGYRKSGFLDWYNAYNPNPIYYRYLPSYWQDPNQRAQVTQAWKTDENVRQINWHGLYDFNNSQNETFNGVTGKRSRFLLSDYVTNTTRFNINSVLNMRSGDHAEFTFGGSYQFQKNENYKELRDLLGGTYYVDLNQFGERAFPNNPVANQTDANNPNRIVRQGDKYGYNYDIFINKVSGWAQGVFKFNNFDFFAALELSGTNFYRRGNYRHGLFLNNSFGDAPTQTFANYAIKGGMTYKLDGRNYFFTNVMAMTKAPFFDNVYVSPRTRNSTQTEVTNEEIKSLEAGYVLNAPKLKMRVTGYYTEFKNQMNVLTFFHDGYQNFVNYGLTGINKTHAGLEIGAEARVIRNVTLNAAANIGRYYYSGARMKATTTLDNDNNVLNVDSIYNLNYRIGGTPQEAYSIGINYRSPKFWFVSLTYNYFDFWYVEINPVRRTYNAVQSIPYKSEEWNQVVRQETLAPQGTLDMFAGWSWKLPKKWEINNKNTFLVFNFSVSNLLNNKNIIQNSFEQLRYDFRTNDVNKFPTRYSYALGLNYSASVALRF